MASFKKNQNAPRPSEHPPVRGGEMSKRLGGIKGCKYKSLREIQMGSPMEITLLGQQYNVGEKPIVILYIFTLIAMQGHQKNINNKRETM